MPHTLITSTQTGKFSAIEAYQHAINVPKGGVYVVDMLCACRGLVPTTRNVLLRGILRPLKHTSANTPDRSSSIFLRGI